MLYIIYVTCNWKRLWCKCLPTLGIINRNKIFRIIFNYVSFFFFFSGSIRILLLCTSRIFGFTKFLCGVVLSLSLMEHLYFMSLLHFAIYFKGNTVFSYATRNRGAKIWDLYLLGTWRNVWNLLQICPDIRNIFLMLCNVILSTKSSRIVGNSNIMHSFILYFIIIPQTFYIINVTIRTFHWLTLTFVKVTLVFFFHFQTFT